MGIIKDGEKPAFFSDAIRYLRMDAHMKQNEMSDAVGVDSDKISKYEHDFTTPDVDILNKICNIFRVPADFFYSEEIFCQNKNAADKKAAIQAAQADIENSSEAFNEEIYSNKLPEDFGRNK